MLLLGGSASPLGWWVEFLEAPADDVAQELLLWRTSNSGKVVVSEQRPFPHFLELLLPLEAPWTREVLFSCGGRTAYLNNFRWGGDPKAVYALTGRLGCRGVAASHSPSHGPGHGGTQLRLFSSGVSVREIAVDAVDGRWSWDQSGPSQDFEEPDRYTARRKRDRLDRRLLLTYLDRLGIPARDEDGYGPGTAFVQQVDWPRVALTLDEARRDMAIDPRALAEAWVPHRR